MLQEENEIQECVETDGKTNLYVGKYVKKENR